MSLALAATLFGPQDLRVVHRELEPLADGMVRVRFGAGGICGSDMHYFRHARTGDFVVQQPLVLGHEIAGEICEVGRSVTERRVGERVAVNPSRWCGHCTRCREGRANLCENIYFMGSASKNPHMQGGFSSLFDAVPAQCVPIPDGMPFEAAALAEPLAVCLHAVARAGEMRSTSVLILGAGPIGLLTMLNARLTGASSIAVADIAAAPLAFARKLGADRVADLSAGEGVLADLAASRPFDIVFEVTGAPAGLAAAIGHVRRGGTVVQIGNLPGGKIEAPMNAVMAKEIDLRGSFRFGDEFAQAVQLIGAGQIDVLSIVTGHYPLTRVNDAMALALDRGRSMKVMLIAD